MTRFIVRTNLSSPGHVLRAFVVATAAMLLLTLIAASPLQAQKLPDATQQMFDAVTRDDLAAVKRQVAAGADVAWRNPRGLTAAELAVEIGHIEIANYLLSEEKARANLPSRPGADKSSAKAAKKSEPSRAKDDAKAAKASADRTPGAPQAERDSAPPAQAATPLPTTPADAPLSVQSRRPRTLTERLAEIMRPEPSQPEPPPAKPESAPPQPTAAAPQTPPEQKADPLSPAERIAARVKERQESERKSLPLPQQQPSEPLRSQRPRTFVEWLADTMAGREPRDVTRRLPEGLREPAEMTVARIEEPPPPDRPTPGVRDPWAPVIAPATPSISPVSPGTAQPPEDALAPPPALATAPPPQPKPLPGEAAPAPGSPLGTSPAPWAPIVERGGEPQIAAAPPATTGTPQEAPTLFARRKDSPPSKKEAAPSGGLFGETQKQGPQLGATTKGSASPAVPAAKSAESKGAEPSGGLWGSTVEMAQARPLVAAPPTAPPVPESVPTGLGFMVGRSLNLDKTAPLRGEAQDTSRSCIEKSRGDVVFCVEAANWPQAMENEFTVNTILYTGQQAVIRYDRGKATRMQTLFPSESFDRVVAYFAGHYGPPAEYWTRSIAPLASARRENPTRAWRARNPKTGQIATLEVRKFDDTRGGFPDTRRGVVMLYYQDAPVIFPQVSALELMRLKRPHLPSPDADGAGEQTPATSEQTPAGTRTQ